MIEPMVGMKFSSKATNPHSTGKSTSKIHKNVVTISPVSTLTDVLMAM